MLMRTESPLVKKPFECLLIIANQDLSFPEIRSEDAKAMNQSKELSIIWRIVSLSFPEFMRLIGNWLFKTINLLRDPSTDGLEGPICVEDNGTGLIRDVQDLGRGQGHFELIKGDLMFGLPDQSITFPWRSLQEISEEHCMLGKHGREPQKCVSHAKE